MAADPQHHVRRLGTLVESIHAVVYFAPEPQAAYAELGLRGYWRGYFASRAAALGAVGPELVTALFAGFAPAMVARAVPEVWSVAAPGDVAARRLEAATAAVRRLAAGLDAEVRAAGALTGRCVVTLPVPGRPLAAAQRGLDRPAEPWAALWHDCTVLREFRGDAHVAAVAAAGLRWPEPHLLQGATVDPRQQEYRGWTDAEWASAAERVHARQESKGPSSGRSAGRPATERRTSALLDDVEAETDRLAAVAFEPLTASKRQELVVALTPIARACATELPYPNAMGLAPLSASGEFRG